jgi:hypothetical protein
MATGAVLAILGRNDRKCASSPRQRTKDVRGTFQSHPITLRKAVRKNDAHVARTSFLALANEPARDRQGKSPNAPANIITI